MKNARMNIPHLPFNCRVDRKSVTVDSVSITARLGRLGFDY